MIYDNRHRTFLQAIMHGGAVLDQEATLLCLKIFDQRVKVSVIAACINQKLAPIAMCMKVGICEITGDKYWSVVSTTHEEAVELRSEFTPGQTGFLLAIYSEIINSEDGYVSSTDCLNLSKSIEYKLTMGDADLFVKDMIKKHWLFQQEGYIYMGVRSIIELMPYFRAIYQDNFRNCALCREILFHGHKCNNCDKVYHNYCLVRYTSRQKEDKCPSCKSALDMGMISDKIMDSQLSATQTQNQEIEDEPMDITEEMDESHVVSTSRRSKKRSKIH